MAVTAVQDVSKGKGVDLCRYLAEVTIEPVGLSPGGAPCHSSCGSTTFGRASEVVARSHQYDLSFSRSLESVKKATID